MAIGIFLATNIINAARWQDLAFTKQLHAATDQLGLQISTPFPTSCYYWQWETYGLPELAAAVQTRLEKAGLAAYNISASGTSESQKCTLDGVNFDHYIPAPHTGINSVYASIQVDSVIDDAVLGQVLRKITLALGPQPNDGNPMSIGINLTFVAGQSRTIDYSYSQVNALVARGLTDAELFAALDGRYTPPTLIPLATITPIPTQCDYVGWTLLENDTAQEWQKRMKKMGIRVTEAAFFDMADVTKCAPQPQPGVFDYILYSTSNPSNEWLPLHGFSIFHATIRVNDINDDAALGKIITRFIRVLAPITANILATSTYIRLTFSDDRGRRDIGFPLEGANQLHDKGLNGAPLFQALDGLVHQSLMATPIPPR
jgi:hypothetical protein